LYRLMRENKLESVKIGSRRLISVTAMAEFVKQLKDGSEVKGEFYGASKSER
jgi:hypothetical protein